MKKDALEPLEGNDLDNDGPILFGGAIRNDGKSKPGVAADTEDVEITDEMLTDVKEWLNLDVSCFVYRTLLNLLVRIAGDNKTAKTTRAYAGKVFVLLLVRYGIPRCGRS